MKILIYGAGVQGTYLAHALAANKNNEVTILARGNRAIDLRENGIVIRHYFQKKITVNYLPIVEELKHEDAYDLIFVTMKYNDFPHVLDTLAQNVSQNIILVGNNLTAHDMESYIKEQSPFEKHILFGFQTTGGKREENQTICVRFGKGQMLINSLAGVIPFKDLLTETFKNTPYQLTYEQKMDDWLKGHAVLVMALNSVSYLHDFNLVKVAADKKLLKAMIQAMAEGFTSLESMGYRMTPKFQATLVQKYPQLAYLLFKLFHYLPMAKVVDGSFAEMISLYTAFEPYKGETPYLDMLQKKAIEHFLENQEKKH